MDQCYRISYIVCSECVLLPLTLIMLLVVELLMVDAYLYQPMNINISLSAAQ